VLLVFLFPTGTLRNEFLKWGTIAENETHPYFDASTKPESQVYVVLVFRERFTELYPHICPELRED
jgi:hypothetical protein